MRENAAHGEKAICEFPKVLAKKALWHPHCLREVDRVDSVDGSGKVRGLFARN
jgi:hypothetical protein